MEKETFQQKVLEQLDIHMKKRYDPQPLQVSLRNRN